MFSLKPIIDEYQQWIFITVCILSGCAHSPIETQSNAALNEVNQFKYFLEAAYLEDLGLSPMAQTIRGVKNQQSKWDCIRDSCEQQKLDLWNKQSRQLAIIDAKHLPPDLQVSYQLFESELARKISAARFRDQHYLLHHYRASWHNRIANLLIAYHKITNLDDANAYIERLKDTLPQVNEVLLQASHAAHDGVIAPPWSLEKMQSSAQNIITGAPFDNGADSPLLADFKSKLHDTALDQNAQSTLVKSARAALIDSVLPAYQAMINHAIEFSGKSPSGDGVWRLPKGKAYYEERLNYFTTTNLNAEQIHAIGVQKVARIQKEILLQAKKLGLDGSFREVISAVANQPSQYYNNDDVGRAAYLNDAQTLVDNMRNKMVKAFSNTPDIKVRVQRIEPFREQGAASAYYQRPNADQPNLGIFYINLRDMRNLPKYKQAALTYHEALPGHHLQRTSQSQTSTSPTFQKYTSFTAYTEGWGLYAEYLAKELGGYSDEYAEIGRLSAELWRACRLVVDTGMHAMRWSRQTAINYLLENTDVTPNVATAAIDRYLMNPGQATAYMIGVDKIKQLRRTAESRLGNAFILADFHKQILRYGPTSLGILERNIENWIEHSLKQQK